MELIDLMRSLRSNVCPACRLTKAPRQSLCTNCYHQLPRKNQKALYCPVGQGYEQAFSDAMVLLRVAGPWVPCPSVQA